MRDRIVFWLKLSTLPVTLGLWYFVYRAYRNADDDDDDRSKDKYFEDDKATTRTSFRVVHIRVPKRAVGAVIGKGGATIKSLQESTRARVSFVNRDTEEDVRDEEEILIRGLGKNVDEAERQIRSIISSIPEIEVEELELAPRFIGPLIGRNGENIRSLMTRTKAKIDVDRSQTVRGANRTVSIRGTREQIDTVLQSIKQLQEEIEEKDRRKQSLLNTTQTLPETDQPLEVLVSVVKNPNTLYLQLTKTCYELNPLVEQMTRFYSKRSCPSRRMELKMGDVVAAIYDTTWHRARVAKATDTMIDVDYLDYGDAGDLTYDEVRPLTEKSFLTLPFQAIEVRLAGIEPLGTDEVAKDKGSSYLEDITYQSKGVPLLARVVSRDGPLPSVILFDPNLEGQDGYNINKRMVASGHCVESRAAFYVPTK